MIRLRESDPKEILGTSAPLMQVHSDFSPGVEPG